MVARTPIEVAGYVHPDPDTWILRFGYTTNPLPMNGSRGKSFYGKAKTGKTIRIQAFHTARNNAKIPPLGRCRAQLTWWVKDNRTRDADNLAEFEKRLFDGLVDAGVVDDDKPELMDKPRGVIRHIREADGLITEPCFTLTVTRIGPAKELLYVVCNRLLDPETNEHCEFDGELEFVDGVTSCPGCHRRMRDSEAER